MVDWEAHLVLLCQSFGKLQDHMILKRNEEWYRGIYFHAGIEIWIYRMALDREGGGWTNWEISIDPDILPCVK